MSEEQFKFDWINSSLLDFGHSMQSSTKSVPDLWNYSKIVEKLENGTLHFNETNFKKILQSFNLDKGVPVNIIAIIGPRGSGKSFYTNLLIQYIKNNGSIGWLTKLLHGKGKADEVLQGFAYGRTFDSGNLIPENTTSGIYTYPEPIFDNSSGTDTIVWVLHMHHVQADNGMEKPDLMEVFLNLVCSKITEIMWERDELNILDTRQSFRSGENGIPKEAFCDNIVYLIRSLTPSTTVTEANPDAIQQLVQIQPSLSQSSLEKIKHIFVANILNCNDPFEDESGKLSVTPDMCKKFQKIMGAVAGDGEFPTKNAHNGKLLTLTNLKKFLASSVQLINRKSASVPKRVVNVFKESSSSVGERDQISNGKERNNEKNPQGGLNSAVSNGQDERFQLEGQPPYCRKPSNGEQEVDKTCTHADSSTPATQPMSPYNLRSSTNKGHDKFPSGSTSGVPMTSEQIPHEDASTNLHQPPVKPATSQKKQNENNDVSETGGNESVVKKEGRGDSDELHVKDSVEVQGRQKENGKSEGKSKDTQVENVEAMESKTTSDVNRVRESVKKRNAEMVKTAAERRKAEEARQAEEKKKIEEERKAREAKEAEEKRKAEAERERRILTELVDFANGQMRDVMLTKLNRWIADIQISTVNNCETMCKESLCEIDNDYSKTEGMSKELRSKFMEQLIAKSASRKAGFSKIQKSVGDFHSYFVKAFKDSGYFDQSILQGNISEKIESALKEVGEQSKQYVRNACTGLGKIYIDHNTKIAESEQQVVEICGQKIRKHYKTTMEQILNDGPRRSRALESIHGSLLEKNGSVLNKKLSFQLENSILREELRKLGYDLKSSFKSYELDNLSKMATFHKQITRSITSSKRQYDLEMDKCLRENPNGVDGQALKKLHDETKEKVADKLQSEIKKYMTDEPIDLHMKTLETHIRNAWIIFMEDNNSNCSNYQPAEDDFSAKRKEQMDQLKQKQKQNAHTSTFSHNVSQTATAESTFTLVNEVKHYEPTQSKASTRTGRQLSSIVFQLSLSKVLVGIVADERGSPLVEIASQAALVALTNDDVFCFGNEVEEQLKSNGLSGFQKVWSIGDCFALDSNEPWSEEVAVMGESRKITVEFLFGLVFFGLKEQIENNRNGVASTAIIIVPFCTCSSQRQQIKDAGKVVGFGDVFLVNENSAVAYAQAKNSKETDPVCHYVVLSENSGKIDVTLYRYQKYSGATLSMLGHCSGNSNQNQSNSLGILQQFLNAGIRALSGYQGNMKAAVEAVIKAWDTTKSDTYYSFNKYARREVLITYESEEWRDVLVAAGKEICLQLSSVEQFHTAMCVAVLFQNPPSRIGACIKDMLSYDIQRYSYEERKFKDVQKRKGLLPNYPQHVKTSLRINEKEAAFSQPGMKSYFGKLEMTNLPNNAQVECKLLINHDGIISLRNVSVTKKGWGGYLPVVGGIVSGETYSASLEDYNWLTPNLAEEEIGIFASLVEFFARERKVQAERRNAKQELVQKCKDALRRIENGEGKFRSELGKGMIIDEINDIIKVANHSRFSEIESQTENLNRIVSKYLQG